MWLRYGLWLALIYILTGCSVKAPADIPLVNNFQLSRYLGTWHEIARLDNHFERGLTRVTATYHQRRDGGISVINRGFDLKRQRWKQVKGLGYFLGEDYHIAALKVSFFGPFYGGYNVIAVSDDYQTALVCGKNRHYLWILSRQKTIPEKVKQHYLKLAKQYGFAVDELIWFEDE